MDIQRPSNQRPWLELHRLEDSYVRKVLLQAPQHTPDSEAKVREEVGRLGGLNICLQSVEKLNELASFVSRAEYSEEARRHTAITLPLGAAELRCMQIPVEQLVQRNLQKFFLDIYNPVPHCLSQNEELSGEHMIEDINDAVSRRVTPPSPCSNFRC